MALGPGDRTLLCPLREATPWHTHPWPVHIRIPNGVKLSMDKFKIHWKKKNLNMQTVGFQRKAGPMLCQSEPEF